MGGNALAKPVSVLEIIEDEDSEKNSGSQGILNLIDYSKNKNNQINNEDAINANNDQNGLSQMTTEIKCKTWLDTNADHYNTKPWDVENDLKNNGIGKITDQVLAHSEIDLSKKEDNHTDTKETTTTTTTTKDDSKDISKEKSSKNESPSDTATSPSEVETTTEDSDVDTEVSKDKSPKLKDVNSKENAHHETTPVSASNTPTKTPVSASNTPTKSPVSASNTPTKSPVSASNTPTKSPVSASNTPTKTTESSSKPTMVTSSDSKQQSSEENVNTKTSTPESSTPETTPDSKESEDVDIPQSPQHITVKSFTLAPMESSASPNPSFTRQRANTSYYRAEPNASQTDKQVEDKVNQDLQEAEQQDPSQLYPCSYSFFSYFYPSETDDGIMAFRHHILAEAGRKFIKGDRLRLFKKKHRDAFEDRRIRKVEYQSNCRIHICKLNRDKFIKGLPRRRIIVFGQNFDDIHLALRCLEETIPEIMEHALFHKPFPHTSKQFQSRSSFTVRKYVSPYLFHRKVVVGPYIQRAWHKLILPHRIIPPVSKPREFDNDENKKDFEEKRPQSRFQGEVLYNALLKSQNPVFTEVNKSQNNSESKKTSSSKQESNFPSRQSECNQNSHSHSAHNQSVSHKSNNSSTKLPVKKPKQQEKSRSASRNCRSQDISHSSALNDSADLSNSKSPASVKTEESVKTDESTEPKDGIRVLKFPYTPTTAALLRHDSNGMSMSNRLSRIESICSCKVKKITPLFGEDYLVTHFKIKVYFTDLNAMSEFCHYLGFNF